jgi:hypothetical protein
LELHGAHVLKLESGVDLQGQALAVLLAVARGLQYIFNAARNPPKNGCVRLIAPEHGRSSLLSGASLTGWRRADHHFGQTMGAVAALYEPLSQLEQF